MGCIRIVTLNASLHLRIDGTKQTLSRIPSVEHHFANPPPYRSIRFSNQLKIPPSFSRLGFDYYQSVINTHSKEQIESPFSTDESFLALHLKKRSLLTIANGFHARKFCGTSSWFLWNYGTSNYPS